MPGVRSDRKSVAALWDNFILATLGSVPSGSFMKWCQCRYERRRAAIQLDDPFIASVCGVMR